MSKYLIEIYDEPPPENINGVPKRAEYLGCFNAPFAFGATIRVHVWWADDSLLYWINMAGRNPYVHRTYQLNPREIQEMRDLAAQKRRVDQGADVERLLQIEDQIDRK